MAIVDLILLAIGLSMDATAIAGTRGLAAKTLRVSDALILAAFFGGAQAIMPLLGWLGGEALSTQIVGWGHWLTFVVFAAIGGKMLYEALSSSPDDSEPKAGNPFDVKVVATLAVATSIDALAAGVTLSIRKANIAVACIVIGLVTAALSFAGAHAGRRFGARMGKRLDIVGGLVILALAAKTLVDHFRGV